MEVLNNRKLYDSFKQVKIDFIKMSEIYMFFNFLP